ncbi:hypothetical protein [Okeania sp. SIO2B3]|uniref:hypothetical protein n=1 Tax=Okeania sp. SIO2B3 TaxID=2607784 RepID=UPI0013C00A43|nr:hypothetical protein [Okeania sp. SIO2B3]NET45414.1 hypothetical protein [Okeania sp. SIO2B3]
MTVIMKKLHVIIVAILASFLASCAGKVDSKIPTYTISSTISEPLAEVKTALQNQPQSPSVKIAIIMDKTGSVNWSRIEQPQLQDFQLLSPLLKRNGGEIAVGTFCYDSNRPLARVRVEQQPVLVNVGFNHPVALYRGEDWPPELYDIILLIAMAILASVTDAGVVYGYDRYQNSFAFFWFRINHLRREKQLRVCQRDFYHKKFQFFRAERDYEEAINNHNQRFENKVKFVPINVYFDDVYPLQFYLSGKASNLG